MRSKRKSGGPLADAVRRFQGKGRAVWGPRSQMWADPVIATSAAPLQDENRDAGSDNGGGHCCSCVFFCCLFSEWLGTRNTGSRSVAGFRVHLPLSLLLFLYYFIYRRFDNVVRMEDDKNYPWRHHLKLLLFCFAAAFPDIISPPHSRWPMGPCIIFFTKTRYNQIYLVLSSVFVPKVYNKHFPI